MLAVRTVDSPTGVKAETARIKSFLEQDLSLALRVIVYVCVGKSIRIFVRIDFPTILILGTYWNLDSRMVSLPPLAWSILKLHRSLAACFLILLMAYVCLSLPSNAA